MRLAQSRAKFLFKMIGLFALSVLAPSAVPTLRPSPPPPPIEIMEPGPPPEYQLAYAALQDSRWEEAKRLADGILETGGSDPVWTGRTKLIAIEADLWLGRAADAEKLLSDFATRPPPDPKSIFASRDIADWMKLASFQFMTEEALGHVEEAKTIHQKLIDYRQSIGSENRQSYSVFQRRIGQFGRCEIQAWESFSPATGPYIYKITIERPAQAYASISVDFGPKERPAGIIIVSSIDYVADAKLKEIKSFRTLPPFPEIWAIALMTWKERCALPHPSPSFPRTRNSSTLPQSRSSSSGWS